MITLNFDEVLERTYNAKKGVDVRYGLGQGFEYCKQFADEAQGYATNAKDSEKKATDAVQAVQNAQTTATNAVQQAQSTATTAVTTKQTEAVQAVGTAQTGAVKAVDDERDAALQQVANSTQAAQTAASNAGSAASAAGDAATAAGDYARNAESSATAASGSASAAATSESNAASSAQSAETDADRAEAAAELAGTRANTDKTLKTENAPADAKAVGDIILDRTKETPQPIFYSKAEVDKLLEDCKEAAKREALLAANPVGKLWGSDDPTSPASIVGGTWERIKDRFILAAGDTYAAGSTGGEATHTLTVNEMPSHNHNQSQYWASSYGSKVNWPFNGYGYILGISSAVNSDASSFTGNGTSPAGGHTQNKGNSQSHNNMPPYLTAYIWRRIA